MDRSDIEGQKTNIQKGKLWPYVKSIQAYHCPSDKRLVGNNGPFLGYYIVGGLNGQDRYETDKLKYKVATKYDQIEKPEEKIVFVEEDAEFGWNPRSWQIYDPQDLTKWTWQDERTLAMSQPPAEPGTITGHTVGHVEQKDNPDLLYMKKTYTHLPK
ncbi:hypothetical protein DRN98_06480 [Methanosarcinales archaeon]|nr:MAG: hypothetical protein DRN98_06480 [Methanosarcinales archaeon]